MTDLLERDPLLDDLAGALAAAATAGRVVLVAGEAGIGKSALVRRFSERHATRARFLFGACDPLLTPRALGPLHDVGRRTGGALAGLLAAGGPREQLFAALLDELERSDRTPVVVVEDAHWADEATLDLLVFLGRRIAQTKALLVVTHRDDELPVDHPLRTVIGLLPARAVRRVQVEPLSEGAVAELARRAGRPAAGLRALTGGNPLLVTEVLAAGPAGDPGGVPLTVRDLALARYAGLAPDARDVVRLVAVVPTGTELWLLDGAPPAAVEAAMAAGLLVAGEDTVRFRHELLRRAVEGSLSAMARRDLNRRILRILAGTHEGTRGGIDVARLVHHAREAGDTAAVLRYAPEAARQAAAVAAHREAVEHYRAVLPLAGGVPDRAELLEGYSAECYLSGLSAEAVTAGREALALREAAGDLAQLGDGLRRLSRLYWWDGNRPEAEAAAARAVTVLEAGPAGRGLAMAYSNQAQLDMLANRLAAAAGWAGRAIGLARRLEDREVLSHALTNIGSARLLGGDPGGRADLEEAFAVAAGLEDDAARALCNLGTISAELRDYRHARADLDRALVFVRAHELAGYVQHVLGHRARVRLDQGDWTGAERDARAALAERVAGGARFVDALVPLGLLQARRGDPAATATLREAAERGYATVELQWTAQVAAARAEHAWLRGADGEIAGEAAGQYELAVRAGHPWFTGELAFWLWQAGALPSVPAVVAEPYRLLLTGDWRGAAAAWRALGCPYQEALALASGEDAGLAALALLDGLGARPAAQRVRRRLRAGGTPRIPRGPIRATAANPAGLTARQVEVLGLLAEELTDAEIAARLSLSVRTVGHHVSALLAKLGAGSRHQAVTAARRLGVVRPEPEPGAEPKDGQPEAHN
ncbi:ATP-binding protein [Dactylosporangium siamense]|uniref:LuxR family transcriptional regulator n=1 Tax=Dactylosporangium siamense TaxID=685454 RepID=A0A919PEX1_9ACTN|nr:AAA family ATPase [Dactylosporangium siamense]GIG42674.1 LuxR family transcriptional regulator [Dactylosporangium siamense]